METWQEAACYIRVSTEDQTEYSPEAQRRALEHYARQHQLTISPEHVYIDAGISGPQGGNASRLYGHDCRGEETSASVFCDLGS